MSPLTCVGTIFLILVTVVSVSSLKCYSCESAKHGNKCNHNPSLSDEDKKLIKKDCEGVCKKTYRRDGTRHVTIRLCDNDTWIGKEWKCTSNWSGDHEDTICYCDSDFCNGSDITKTSLFFSFCLLIGIVLKFK